MSRGPHFDHPYSFDWDGTDYTREFTIEVCQDEANRQISEDLECFFKDKGLSGDELDNAVEAAFETITY